MFFSHYLLRHTVGLYLLLTVILFVSLLKKLAQNLAHCKPFIITIIRLHKFVNLTLSTKIY